MTTTTLDKSDIPIGGWIDRFAPVALRPYLRLMRLDRPIGTWLLLLPGWWSLALAADGWPDARLIVLFAAGAVVMRGAGCVFNDIADRNVDRLVARTAARPIASGAVTPRQGVVFLAVLLMLGLSVLLALRPAAMAWGVLALPLVFTYPFMKRITYWPQAWLGLTFNWGALLGWVAAGRTLAAPPLLLYAAGVFWTLGYDTIYAHQDKDDDALAGVKSTALRLGAATPVWLCLFYGLTLAMLSAAGRVAGVGAGFYGALAVAGLHLAWQIRQLDVDDAAVCLRLFRSNRVFGWLVLVAIIAGRVAG
jgi:4-hydroxybenzoate polyprenyltransferase